MTQFRWPQYAVYAVRVHWRESPIFYFDKCGSDGRVTFIKWFGERETAEAAKLAAEKQRDGD